MNVLEQCEKAKEASLELAAASADVKNIVLKELAADILMNKAKIIKANKLDVKQNKNISKAMLKRLKVDDKKIKVNYINEIKKPQEKFLFQTDSEKFYIVISNLLSNAIEYSTNDGEIFIKIWGDIIHLNISIINHGIIIHETDQKRIFDRFIQLDTG